MRNTAFTYSLINNNITTTSTCASIHPSIDIDLVSSSSEHDEVLYIVANQLEGILDLVGGSKHGSVLLEPLEQLCKVEETLVRESAVHAANKLAGNVKKDALESAFLPMVQRLAAGDWFTSRVSACGMIADALKRTNSGDVKKKLVEIYTQVCMDGVVYDA
jgi:serine/threonine-protein phosphatase 2A regulatory subunit A